MKKLLISVSVLLTLLSASVSAWDGTISGVVDHIHVAPNDKHTFRVQLKDNPVFCDGGTDWAYISNHTDYKDIGYETVVSALLAAKMAEKTVNVYSNKDSNGYCKIGYVVVL